MESWTRVFDDRKPFLAMVSMQFSYAVMSIIVKCAMNHGMSPHVSVAYRLVVASVLIMPITLSMFSVIVSRVERVEIRRVRSQVKVVGTVVTVGRATMMTLIKDLC
ncbi:hypothetical protein V6N11_053944 [Hibiscus sabdariffa]|uniref:WAT1-related protein n=1 Tax=Hibiscus sabdariffa TaxID=183260 RepID=A0ABR2S2F2_9ROSI